MRIIDGFVWKLIPIEKANIIFACGLFEIYGLRFDGSEYLIENVSEIDYAVRRGHKLGIEVGSIKA